MRDYEIRIFLQLQPTQKWAVRCVMDYFRYQQTVFTSVFISKAPFDGENSKFLRDLNIIVKLNFYTESTGKHLESDFGPFWNYQKSPVTKSNFLQA